MSITTKPEAARSKEALAQALAPSFETDAAWANRDPTNKAMFACLNSPT